MTNTGRLLPAALVIAALCAAAPQARALPSELITNGNFETGDLSGWTASDSGNGSWYASAPGSSTPVSGNNTSAAGGGPHGTTYAVTDELGPNMTALVQSFTVDAGAASVVLSFDMFVNSYAEVDCSAGFNGGQCGRVDVLTASADAFDTGSTVLATLYMGADALGVANPFTHYSFDLTSLLGGGGSFQLRFAQADYQYYLNQGVDNVSIAETSAQAVAVPEPASLALLAVGAVGAGSLRRRRA